MSASISMEELKKIPYLRPDLNLNGRIFHMVPYWDGNEWHLWFSTDNGELMPMTPVDAHESLYVAKDTPAKPTDIEILFINLMWQQAGYQDIYKRVTAITKDFSNMALSLAKIEHIFNTRDSIKNGSARGFVATEIEYLLVLSRSIFDLLYEILVLLWRSTKLLDEEGNATKRTQKLPDKLSKLIFTNNLPKNAQSISDTHGVPLSLAKTLEACAPFISYVRAARDRIVHNGNSIGIIFDTEKGFCVTASEHPFSDYYSNIDITNFKYQENGLVSLWPWLCHIVLGTIEACNEIASSFSKIVKLPEEIAPGYKVFIRDPSNHALVRVLEICNGGYPWWDTPLPQDQ